MTHMIFFCLHLRGDSLNSKSIFLKALNLKYFKFVSCRFIRATTKTLLIGLEISPGKPES